MTRDEMAVAAHEEAEMLTHLRGPGATTLLSTHTVDRVILFLRAVDAALRAPAVTGEAERRINTRCPSCGSTTLFVAEGGHLTCSLIGCKQPVVERAIAELRAAPPAAGAPPAVAGGDAPEIRVGDWARESVTSHRPFLVEAGYALDWCNANRGDLVELRGERNGQPFIWRRREGA